MFPLQPTRTSCLLSGDNPKQEGLTSGMMTDWVMVMVSSSYKDSVDTLSVNEYLLVARKDPER